jgi:Family of unknown function (DUF6941)
MSSAGPEPEANMLLCDAATISDGKLFILGGGWSSMLAREESVTLTFAAIVSVPWHLTNRKIRLELQLLSEDGTVVETVDGKPATAGGELTIGRPAHVRPGVSQNVPFVAPFRALPLLQGGYVCTLALDGRVYARTPFQIMRP